MNTFVMVLSVLDDVKRMTDIPDIAFDDIGLHYRRV